MGIDENAFAQKSQTSHGGERNRETRQNNLSMSGTFKITKRENMQVGSSSQLVKSEQRMRRRQPFTKSTAMIGSMPAINVKRDEAIKRVEMMRQQNNNELLAILEEE